jgi:hypothetical protein
MNNTKKIVESVALAIREKYIDEKKANIIADKILQNITNDVWQNHIKNNDIRRLMSLITCIFYNEVDDRHFSIYIQGDPVQSAKPPIVKVTPHYIRFAHIGSIADENNRIAYLEAFNQFESPLIIDLRDCPGGDAETEVFILSHFFADNEPLFYYTTRQDGQKSIMYKAGSIFTAYKNYNTVKKFNGEVRVLINAGTASAAEAIAFVLQNKKRAKIYGSTSAGVAHLTLTYNIPGIDLRLPFAKMQDVESKKDWEKVGIIPDFDISTKECINLFFNELISNFITQPISNLNKQVINK